MKHAQATIDNEAYEWSCFAAQQAAEKALKALFISLHGDPWGPFILALMEGLPDSTRKLVGEALLDSARALDKHYIPTRYPNGFAQGAPMDYYTKRDAEESIGHAKSILEFCRLQVHQSNRDSEAGATDSSTNGSTPQ